jgi:hypothetical protein
MGKKIIILVLFVLIGACGSIPEFGNNPSSQCCDDKPNRSCQQKPDTPTRCRD